MVYVMMPPSLSRRAIRATAEEVRNALTMDSEGSASVATFAWVFGIMVRHLSFSGDKPSLNWQSGLVHDHPVVQGYISETHRRKPRFAAPQPRVSLGGQLVSWKVGAVGAEYPQDCVTSTVGELPKN